jgi:universal stress protein E
MGYEGKGGRGAEMQPITSILVSLEREGDPSHALKRAVMLARRFNARIELFLCEAERAYALQHQYDSRGNESARRSCAAESRAWMERVWQSLDVNDVPVLMDTVYESPLCEGIRRKVQNSHADLVVRGIGDRECTFSVADSDLVLTCPVLLLLTRGKPWRARAVVAAAIDVSGDEAPELTRAILVAADRMAASCGASLELLYANRFDDVSSDAVESSRTLLRSRAAAANVQPQEVHVVIGEPLTAIPQFAGRRGYEMVVFGALTHLKSITTLVGRLTGRLVEALDCDLLLVKP